MAPGIDGNRSSPTLRNRADVQTNSTVKFRIESLLLRFVVKLIRSMPLDVAVRMGGRACRLLAPHLSRHKRAVRHLADAMPDVSPAERDRIVRAMWDNLGQTFTESLVLDRLAALPERIVLDEGCQTLLRRTKEEGAIIVTPHLGNWEAAVLPLAAAGGVHAGVYRKLKNPLIDVYLRGQRQIYYKGGLFAKGNDAARGLMRQAGAGCSIGIMADLRDEAGVRVPFFGKGAPSTSLPALLARKLQRPIFAVCLVRTGTARFRMEATEVAVSCSQDRTADVLETTARIQLVLESWIRRWPDQWMWAHRRFDAARPDR